MQSSSFTFNNPAEVHAAVGREAFVTDWITIDQRRLDDLEGALQFTFSTTVEIREVKS